MEVMAWAEGAPKKVATRVRANRAIGDRLGIVGAPLPGQRALRTGAVTCGWVSVKPNMRRPPTHWPAAERMPLLWGSFSVQGFAAVRIDLGQGDDVSHASSHGDRERGTICVGDDTSLLSGHSDTAVALGSGDDLIRTVTLRACGFITSWLTHGKKQRDSEHRRLAST
jgi:hypothetical protein